MSNVKFRRTLAFLFSVDVEKLVITRNWHNRTGIPADIKWAKTIDWVINKKLGLQ